MKTNKIIPFQSKNNKKYNSIEKDFNFPFELKL